MKITAQNMEDKKTTLDDNAAIYGKRDERDTKEKFAQLKGKDKWDFFKDYILGKLVIITASVVFAVFILYSIFGPKPETLMYVAVIDDPLGNENLEKMSEVLTERFVTDTKKEKIIVDGNYYFISDDYNARMKFMTLTAAGEVDFCIIPKNELENYLDSEMFACLDDIMETRELEKYGLNVYRTPSDKKAWGINVSSLINSTLGYDAGNDYYAACVVNSKHEEQFAAFVDFILSNQ